MDKLLTTDEAAERLDMSRRQVQTYIRQGHLPATRYGRDWFLDPTVVADFRRSPRGWPKGKPRKKPKKAPRR